MADLVARGPQDGQEWRRTLPADEVTLGRSASMSMWDVPWDMQISRLHASLHWQDGQLHVRRLEKARHPIYFQGKERDQFVAELGERFVIGETAFVVEDSTRPGNDSRVVISELTCSPQELRAVTYVDPLERIEVLAALPSVIRNSDSEKELANRVAEVLLQGIPRAEIAAVVKLRADSRDGAPQVEVDCSRSRQGALAIPFKPSRTLVADAIAHKRQSVMHVWEPGALDDRTANASYNWALCVPLQDEAFAGWGLYVAGVLSSDSLGNNLVRQEVFKSDLKFTELVAEIFSSLRQVLVLQRRETTLSRFLSRAVRTALRDKDMEEVLKPREADVAVLFCDLRGSCRFVEEGRDNLWALWKQVSDVLNIMAECILYEEGVVGDFQGDAAMGFWGWPLTLEPRDSVERAARAALAIRRKFVQRFGQNDSLLGCGIGIASGRAIAGKLGSDEQFKVDVFGPIVNLAARLESMTKFFRVPILFDESSAQYLNDLAASLGGARSRRVARVVPYGMKRALTVSQLLPPRIDNRDLSDVALKDYEKALEAFQKGSWPEAARLLSKSPGDGPSQFLRSYMDRAGEPPTAWDGVIVLDSK